MTSNQNFRIHSVLVLSIFIFLFALAACEKAKPAYKFRGTLEPTDTGAIYLVYDTFRESVPIPFDTAMIKDGSFEFTGAVPYPMPCQLIWPSGNSSAYFIIENSDITMDTLTNQFGFVVRGSVSQREAEEVDELSNNYYNGLNTALDSLASVEGISIKRKDSLLAESRKSDSLAEAAYYQKLADYVKAHSTSYGALFGWRDPDLVQDGSIPPARKVFEQFDPALKSSTRGQQIETYLRHYESLRKGQPAPELNLIDSDGKAVALSTYKGKKVIFFAEAYGDLSDKDLSALSKLSNTVIIVNNPVGSWKKLKCVAAYEPGQSDFVYRRTYSEMDPYVFVIDEQGRIASKGYSWTDPE